jgi:ribose transport system permease protein
MTGAAQQQGRHPKSDGEARPPGTEQRQAARSAIGRLDLRVDRLSGVYVGLVLVLIYSFTDPTFRSLNNLRVIASSQAITGILALGLIVSLICGVFDISIAGNMSLAITLVGWLQTQGHLSATLAVVVTVLTGSCIGVFNAIVITKLHVDAVIGTLGTSSILAAVAYLITKGNDIFNGIDKGFKRLGASAPFTIPVAVYFLLGIAVTLWYVLEHTPVGRYFHAVGSNAQASRLAGLPVVRVQWIGLIVSGSVAAFAGVMLTMQLGASSFGAGNPYLLPAFAAAFLGSTQIKPGRFNVVGTLVAIYLLAVGVKGLQLHYPGNPWISDLFNGLALIFAVALSRRSQRRRTMASRA